MSANPLLGAEFWTLCYVGIVIALRLLGKDESFDFRFSVLKNWSFGISCQNLLD
ncbi:hypothetical protein LEP1GSC038_4367 [Leptospira weilii str. 2006001855]|uniref:Uncharacterized protein n=1 Tax=Leptospira weilii str. 2006001855 TaxID=996804 RepID=M6FX75_9LEPT|nr:hypothetical protein LEP1GSC038_4367 [Leptospira weilii str. 2006001855]